jgi:hypothetical protein
VSTLDGRPGSLLSAGIGRQYAQDTDERPIITQQA